MPGAADASLGGLSIEVSSEKAAALAALAVVITHAASRCVQDDDVLAFFAARAEVAAAAAATAKAALPVERRAPGAVRSTLLAVRRLAQSVRVRVRVHAIRLVLDALADDGAESAGSGSFPECSANVPSVQLVAQCRDSVQKAPAHEQRQLRLRRRTHLLQIGLVEL